MQRGKNDCYQWLSNSSRECIKFDFGRGFAPDPAWGTYSVSPHPLAGLKGPTSKGRGGKGTGKGKEKEGRGGRGRGMVGTGTGKMEGKG